MIFNTPIFYLFFLLFLVGYGLVLLRHKPRIYFIVVASLIFYGAWNYRFIPLLLFSAVADDFIAQAIEASDSRRKKKRWLSLSVVLKLGLLGLFKYADFVLASVADFLGLFGVTPDVPTLSWVLPVGISFYTFQSLSYTIDVYRGEMKPRKGLMEFVAALSFFPQLVAGPILRARQILPQMHSLPVPTWDNAKHGFLLITAGVFKKTLADLLAHPAAKAFDTSSGVSVLESWTGVLAFAGQIYGDFAGCTDMAIGLALVLGFQIPLNFRLPYFALSPIDFWRRWHISLSTWLRDYLYISLGGNRNHLRLRNVMITMLLGGLWHGAAWTFVAWGAFHGLLITASHRLSRVKALAGFHGSNSPWIRGIKVGGDRLPGPPRVGPLPGHQPGVGGGDSRRLARLRGIAARIGAGSLHDPLDDGGIGTGDAPDGPLRAPQIRPAGEQAMDLLADLDPHPSASHHRRRGRPGDVLRLVDGRYRLLIPAVRPATDPTRGRSQVVQLRFRRLESLLPGLPGSAYSRRLRRGGSAA